MALKLSAFCLLLLVASTAARATIGSSRKLNGGLMSGGPGTSSGGGSSSTTSSAAGSGGAASSGGSGSSGGGGGGGSSSTSTSAAAGPGGAGAGAGAASSDGNGGDSTSTSAAAAGDAAAAGAAAAGGGDTSTSSAAAAGGPGGGGGAAASSASSSSSTPSPTAPVCPAAGPGDPCNPDCTDQCVPNFSCNGFTDTCELCFPGDAAVTVQRLLQNGTVASLPARMDELSIGDMVLTRGAGGAAAFEPVYLFGHKDAGPLSVFVQIVVEGAKQPLEMTAGHFVHVAAAGGSRANAYMSRAGAVRPGYRVLLPVDGAFALRTVTKVSTVNKAGLYNPYTLSGDIVVNGMLASCHSDWVLDGVMPARYTHLLPAIYQALLAPVRLVYHAVGPAAMRRLEARLDFAGKANAGLSGYARTFAAATLTALAGKA